MKKVGFVSLGCSKNLIDTEIMIGLVKEAGYEIYADESKSDVIIINTCGFIDSAKEEAINTILEMAEYKKTGCLKKLIVTGCLAERYKDEILKEMPEVDAVVGVNNYVDIVSVIEGGKDIYISGELLAYPECSPRVRTTPPYTADIKIAEGCDNHCTYCAIPAIRGKQRSRRIENVIKEAQKMYDEGVRELNVIAQDTTRYGIDLYGEPKLCKLLSKLSDIDFKWIRLYYTYPELLSDELLSVIAEKENIVSYFDIPLQHISDRVLKRMGRRSTKKEIYTLINKIKESVPGAILRTTFIVGFPGETEEDFEELCNFVRETEFDRMGVFIYSEEEGTPAVKLDNKIDEETKKERYHKLMCIAKEISERKCRARVGETLTVLAEYPDGYGYVGRSIYDAPDIDGKVFFMAQRDVSTGEFVKVKILDYDEYDLTGVVTDEFTE